MFPRLWLWLSHHLHSPWKTPLKPLVSTTIIIPWTPKSVIPDSWLNSITTYPNATKHLPLNFPQMSQTAYAKASLSISSPKTMFPNISVQTLKSEISFGLQQLSCALQQVTRFLISSLSVLFFPSLLLLPEFRSWSVVAYTQSLFTRLSPLVFVSLQCTFCIVAWVILRSWWQIWSDIAHLFQPFSNFQGPSRDGLNSLFGAPSLS